MSTLILLPTGFASFKLPIDVVCHRHQERESVLKTIPAERGLLGALLGDTAGRIVSACGAGLATSVEERIYCALVSYRHFFDGGRGGRRRDVVWEMWRPDL